MTEKVFSVVSCSLVISFLLERLLKRCVCAFASFLCTRWSKKIFCQFLCVICLDVNSCLLSVFGAVLAAATLYDVLSSVRCKTLHNAGLQSAMTDDGDDDHDSLANSHQPVIFSRTDDLPLILDAPEYDSNCQHACGICCFFCDSQPTFLELPYVKPVPKVTLPGIVRAGFFRGEICENSVLVTKQTPPRGVGAQLLMLLFQP